jgi:signal transduction histidine kinase
MKMRRFMRVAVLLAAAQMLLAGGVWWLVNGPAPWRGDAAPRPAVPLPVAQQRLAEVYAQAAFRAVITSDYAALNGLVRPSETWPEVAYVTVEDAQGKIIASSDPSKVGRTWNAALAGELRAMLKGPVEETSASLVDGAAGKGGAPAGQVRVGYLVTPPPSAATARPAGVRLLLVLTIAALAAIPEAFLVEVVARTVPGMTPREHRLLDQLRETRMEAQRLRDDAASVRSERDDHVSEIEALRTSITHYLVELQKLRADAALVEAHLAEEQMSADAEAAPTAEPALDPRAEVGSLKELHVRTVTQMAQAFRSSLTNIVGYSKLLLRGGEGDLSPMQRTNVANILDSGTRLVALVNGLSDYVRVDAGMNPPVPATVDLGALLTKILAEAQRRGRRLGGAAVPGGLLVHADPRHVEQIVRALAADAMALDPQATGRLSATSRDGRVVVELHLGGARLAPEDRRQLLDPFGAADDASRPLDEGRLRLALARGVAEANGGHLRLRTEDPDEVAFVLDLPSAPAPVAS